MFNDCFSELVLGGVGARKALSPGGVVNVMIDAQNAYQKGDITQVQYKAMLAMFIDGTLNDKHWLNACGKTLMEV